MAKRLNLIILRAKNGLTKQQMAEKIGVSYCTYLSIENGKRGCSQSFLNKLQAAFEIPDSEMWELIKIFE